MFDKVPFYGQVLIFAAMALAIVGVAYFIYPPLGDIQVTQPRRRCCCNA